MYFLREQFNIMQLKKKVFDYWSFTLIIGQQLLLSDWKVCDQIDSDIILIILLNCHLLENISNTNIFSYVIIKSIQVKYQILFVF